MITSAVLFAEVTILGHLRLTRHRTVPSRFGPVKTIVTVALRMALDA